MLILLTDASIRGAVLDNVCVALRAVTVAGGYRWDVRAESVQTDPMNPLTVPLDKLPFFLVEAAPTGQREFQPANALKEYFRLVITAVAMAEGLAADRKTAVGEALAADVERALCVDIERGGLCSDTRVLVPEIIVGLGTDNKVVLVQEIECRIHRDHGAP